MTLTLADLITKILEITRALVSSCQTERQLYLTPRELAAIECDMILSPYVEATGLTARRLPRHGEAAFTTGLTIRVPGGSHILMPTPEGGLIVRVTAYPI